MSASDDTTVPPQDRHEQFEPTHWTVVLAAARRDLPGGREALEKLCSSYWFPLYAFVRRQGIATHNAEDLVQGFFEHLLIKNLVAQARPEDGRFRTFLLRCLKNFMKDDWRRMTAKKRGGGESTFSFDAEEAHLEITDNGAGFEVPYNWIDFVRQGHYGLAGAAERANALGGTFKVKSKPGSSTTIQVTIPWKDSND